VVKGAKMPASTHAGVGDDVKITALKLPPGTLSTEMDAYFKKCDEKLGFVPNVLKAFAFDDGKLKAFVDYRHQLVQNAANLSKLEIEMIATVVSSQNRCFYCITAHGNAVRQLGDPVLGEMMVMNYRAARLNKRQRATPCSTSRSSSRMRRGKSRRKTASACAAQASMIATSGISPRSPPSTT